MHAVAITSAVCRRFARIAPCVAASPATLAGVLCEGIGAGLDSTFMDVRMRPRIDIGHHAVVASGSFKSESETRGDVVVFAKASSPASSEAIVPAGTAGTVSLNLVSTPAQAVEGRVVDIGGKGSLGAIRQVRYSEPCNPNRSVPLDGESVSVVDGRFILLDAGIAVPFVVDAHANGFVAPAATQFEISDGDDESLQSVTMSETGATVTVRLLNKSEAPVRGAEVAMTADPAGRSASDRGSWLRHKSFLQVERTSSLESVRFDGVPHGRIRVRAKTLHGVTEEYTVVSSGQEFRLTLRAPE